MYMNSTLQLNPLVRVVAMLILGIALGDVLADVVGVRIWLGIFVVAVAAAFVAYNTNVRPMVQSLMLFGCIIIGGALRMSMSVERSHFYFIQTSEPFSAVVSSMPVERTKTLRCELTIADGRFAGHRVYAYLPKGKDANNISALSIGDGIVGYTQFLDIDDYSSQHGAYNKGGAYNNIATHFDYQRWLKVHDIVARCFLRDGAWQRDVVQLDHLSGVQRVQLRCMTLREKLLKRYRELAISNEAYGVVAAMTLGDKSSLTAELRESFSVSGASHVLALSGLHLGILYALLVMIFGRRRHNILMSAFIIIAVWGYTAMVGMPLSLLRSAFMLTLFTFAQMLQRNNVSLNYLAFAALVLLLASPWSLWDVGFQMSFLAVLGILLFNERLRVFVSHKYLETHPLVNWCFSMIVVSLSAQLMVAPLVAYYFGRFSCYFLLSNFIAIPLATVLIYLSVVMYALFFVPCLQGLVAIAVGWIAKALTLSLAWVSSLSAASVDGIELSNVQLWLVYLVVAVVYALLFYLEKIYKPFDNFQPRV